MKFTEHRLNILKIICYDLNGMARACDVEIEFKNKFGRWPGNVYTDLNDLITLGFIKKEEDIKRYTLTERGRDILSIKCGEPPRVDLMFNGIIIQKVKLDEKLFNAITESAKKEGQQIDEWVIEVLELAAEVER
jgi:DNA-binding PadR family transcriptional regulator